MSSSATEPRTQLPHPTRRHLGATASGVAAVVFCAAIFGFFYAWVCSTMWGLDNADPRIAIAAMQEMNESVRNAVFFPAFFLTPAVAACAAWAAGPGTARRWFIAAAVIYTIGGLFLTMAINVPMNEALAESVIPDDPAGAAEIWAGYSPAWQAWNITRAVASGIALICATLGVRNLGPRT